MPTKRGYLSDTEGLYLIQNIPWIACGCYPLDISAVLSEVVEKFVVVEFHKTNLFVSSAIGEEELVSELYHTCYEYTGNCETTWHFPVFGNCDKSFVNVIDEFGEIIFSVTENHEVLCITNFIVLLTVIANKPVLIINL